MSCGKPSLFNIKHSIQTAVRLDRVILTDDDPPKPSTIDFCAFRFDRDVATEHCATDGTRLSLQMVRSSQSDSPERWATVFEVLNELPE